MQACESVQLRYRDSPKVFGSTELDQMIPCRAEATEVRELRRGLTHFCVEDARAFDTFRVWLDAQSEKATERGKTDHATEPTGLYLEIQKDAARYPWRSDTSPRTDRYFIYAPGRRRLSFFEADNDPSRSLAAGLRTRGWLLIDEPKYIEMHNVYRASVRQLPRIG